MDEWESKIEKLAMSTIEENVYFYIWSAYMDIGSHKTYSRNR